MNKKIKVLALGALMLAFAIVLLWLTQRLLVPKYMSDIPEGALIAEYYNETVAHDVVFVGDCEVYENFSPITLWKEYGISSYIRGSAQQLIWQSYYLLEDVYRYETPQVVVFNVLSMKYGEPQSESYNRLINNKGGSCFHDGRRGYDNVRFSTPEISRSLARTDC